METEVRKTIYCQLLQPEPATTLLLQLKILRISLHKIQRKTGSDSVFEEVKNAAIFAHLESQKIDLWQTHKPALELIAFFMKASL